MVNKRVVRAPRGTQLQCKSWLTEAPFRMIQNNLDAEVAERPEDLVVYGGRGQAARSWEAYDAILDSLQNLEDNETLLVQPTHIIRLKHLEGEIGSRVILNQHDLTFKTNIPY